MNDFFSVIEKYIKREGERGGEERKHKEAVGNS